MTHFKSTHTILLFIIISILGSSTAFAQQRKVPPLPDNVIKKQVTIWSDGTRMFGELYLPKETDPNQKLPVVIFCAGTGGTIKGTPRRHGPIFAQAGYAFLAFDYRGWGSSESQLMALDPQPKPDENGEMTIRVRALRWQMSYTDQTEDIRAAISFIAGEPGIDANRIGLFGTSYGGGLVTAVAAMDPRVKCVVAQVPGMRAGLYPAATARDYKLHRQQARGETEPVPYETGKFGGKMATYSQMRTNHAKSITFSNLRDSKNITAPMLIIDAENEELMDRTKNGQAIADALKKRGAIVKYHMIKGIGHYGIYREKFAEATKMEIEWFDQYLKP